VAEELICSRCATSVRELFTPDEFRQLHDAGIVTEADVRRVIERMETQSLI